MANAIIRLRRDNDYNYAKIKDRFIPANGEICLVDTADSGLRIICGDGQHTFGQLSYIDNYLKWGFYRNNTFFTDVSFQDIIPALTNTLYIDKPSSSLYYFNGEAYQIISGNSLPTANATTPGLVKLYDCLGDNEDGTMTQRAITNELKEKVEIELNKEEELLIFSY